MSATTKHGSVWRSTSLKLLIVFLASFVCVICLLQGIAKLVFNYSQQNLIFRSQNHARYATLLAKELEADADPKAAVGRLEHDLKIGARVEDLSGHALASSTSLAASIADVESGARRIVWTPELKSGEFKQAAFAIANLGSHRYLFFFLAAPALEMQLQSLPALMAVILFILLASFLLIRWLFQPVSWLSNGIRRLGEGDFDVRVPARPHDELGDLAQSFNDTVARVRSIVDSKRQLLLDVSHELRSPLTRIKVALELDGPKSREQVRRNVLVLESMIHDLLESARLGSAQPALQLEQIDLGALLSEAAHGAQTERPGVVFSAPPEPALLRGDRKRIEICVKNVLDNALKYSSGQTAPVELSLERGASSALRVQVRDFGVGIAEAERDLIFEPFYRVDKARVQTTGGFGLGLSLCRQIMTAHGGQIQVAAPVSGNGSVFTLEFPSPIVH